jgi:hypothetical protein
MTVTYSTSWSFLGGNPKKRHNTVKVTTENGKTKSINIVKSFATEQEAKQHAEKLNSK